ncbi:MAG: GrpB family protein, partial [Erysipelotrichaceae bacterium]|nr:GrpB family protein [Erysipelotrichaceae bacterium]
MTKKLSEMTIEELWKLFPIVLTKHQTVWETFFKEEVSILKCAFEDKDVVINHIGSTTVEGLWAKPIIDILVEIPSNKSLAAYYALIRGCGYRLMSEAPNRASFNKGYTEKGFAERVFHLHLRFYGDHDEL